MGTILAWAPNFAPQYFQFCKGQTLSISQYSALFAILGTTYGGNGVSTFQLPNLSGRVPVGAGQSGGTSNYVLGQIGGTESVTLTINQLPAHTHVASLSSVTVMASSLDATDHYPSTTANVIAGPYDTSNLIPYAGFNSGPADTALNVGGGGGAVTVNPTGSGTAVSLLQPYLAINYIICIQGLFPPRN